MNSSRSSSPSSTSSPSVWDGISSYLFGTSPSPSTSSNSSMSSMSSVPAGRSLDSRGSKYGKAPSMPMSSRSSSMSSRSSMSGRQSTSLDMRLKHDLASLKPGQVIDITGLSDSNQYKIVKAPSAQDAHVVFHQDKIMSLNEKDVRYAGYALLDDGLVGEFLSAEELKMSSPSMSRNRSSKLMVVKPGHALDVDSFDSTKKATMVKVPADLDQSNMVLFYDGKLLAADDAEDDVQAYASYVANGDEKIENGILASYYDENAKKMLGASRVASSSRSRSPYMTRSRMSNTQLRPSPAVEDVTMFVPRSNSFCMTGKLPTSPAVSDVSSYMSGSSSSRSRFSSPVSSRTRYSQLRKADDGPSFDDDIPVASRTRSKMEPSFDDEAPVASRTRSKYQPSASSKFSSMSKQSALKPSSVRYSSKSNY